MGSLYFLATSISARMVRTVGMVPLLLNAFPRFFAQLAAVPAFLTHLGTTLPLRATFGTENLMTRVRVATRGPTQTATRTTATAMTQNSFPSGSMLTIGLLPPYR